MTRSPGRRRAAGAAARLLVALCAAVVLSVVSGCDEDPAAPSVGRQWVTSLEPQYTNRSVWGVSATHFFVTSERGAVSRYRDGTWTTWQFEYFQNLRSVWGVDADHVMVVGESGLCLRFNGQEWSSLYPGTTNDLHSV